MNVFIGTNFSYDLVPDRRRRLEQAASRDRLVRRALRQRNHGRRPTAALTTGPTITPTTTGKQHSSPKAAAPVAEPPTPCVA